MLIHLANALSEKGHEIDFLVGNSDGPGAKWLGQGLRLVDFNVTRTIQIVPGLVRYLRSHTPAALISTPLHVNVAATMAWLAAGKPCALIVREAVNLSAEGARSRLPAYRIAPWAYRRASAVACVSEGVATDLIQNHRIPAAKIRVVPNPTITESVLALARREVNHPWFNSEIPVILGVGRLTRQKSFGTLIRAVSRVRESMPVRLVILGDGPQRVELEHLIESLRLQDCVDLVGYQPNPYPFLANADLFVLSSEWEGSPNALIEALACGTPVVATDCPSGPREILQSGKYGPLVAVGDHDAMARAIVEQLNRNCSREMLQQRGMMYSDCHAAEEYLELIAELTAGKA